MYIEHSDQEIFRDERLSKYWVRIGRTVLNSRIEVCVPDSHRSDPILFLVNDSDDTSVAYGHFDTGDLKPCATDPIRITKENLITNLLNILKVKK